MSFVGKISTSLDVLDILSKYTFRLLTLFSLKNMPLSNTKQIYTHERGPMISSQNLKVKERSQGLGWYT